VARRTQEIGIRRALGATPGALVRHIVTQGMAPVAAGLAVGLLASLGAARLLASLLYDTSPSDPATLLAVTAVVVGVAVAACAVPARRALAVNPIVAIRGE
jgi:ABC-type antimicrobial peptide transport system permease subunit